MRQLVLDGNKISSMEEVHQILAEGLEFPSYYGKNLDALMDCLTDICEDTEITVVKKTKLSLELAPKGRVLIKVLKEASLINPHLHVEFVRKL